MQLLWGRQEMHREFLWKNHFKTLPSKTRNGKGSESYPTAASVISDVELWAHTSSKLAMRSDTHIPSKLKRSF
jgi:hypothetical protein